MANEAEILCGQLASAVRAMMDPTTPSQTRLEAFNHCEGFKEASEPAMGIQCAIMLSSNPDMIVRHFGLKLLEDVIKLRWNDMTPEQKLYVKESAMGIMNTGIVDIVKSPTHIKDAIARSVVEIAKREWPQQWPGFLAELEALSTKGDAQAELVMFVMLRLVEDVAVLQTLEQNQRRKEIYQALSLHMETIFKFLLTLLERHYQAYITNPMKVVKDKHAKVCQSVLATFTAFVEWAPIQHIMANDHYLVRCLCHLLRDEALQIHAAECLLGIVSWKAGKISDRAQLMVLFKSDLISPLFEAVEAANVKTMQGEDDQHYLLLKRMVQLLVELGGQVCAIWNAKEANCPKQPENFNIYLNALLAFTNHNSLMVNYYANELWAKFCRHPEILKDDIFQGYITKWVECALKKAVKVGLPSKDDHPACAYSRMDCETDEEFHAFFGKYRVIMGEIIRLIASNAPQVPYQFCDQWLRAILARPLSGRLSKTSMTYLELDTVQWALDAILSKLSTPEELAPVLSPGLELLKLCLESQNHEDPVHLSVMLSCISSLFAVVTVTPAALNPTLTCIFKCITFTKNNNFTADEDVRSLRRHGCALVVKIASRYPATLVPVFEYLRHTIVDELFIKSKALFKMEFVTLVEGLVLVSNEFQNYEAQSGFIESLAKPVCEEFKALEVHFSSPEALMAFIFGNDKAEHRSEVAFCLEFFVSLIRRASVPSDLLKCRSTGFIDPTVSEVVALRNPAGGVASHILGTVLKLTKTFIDLFKARQSPVYSKIFEMLDIEKANVHGAEECDNNQKAEPKLLPDEKKLQVFVFEQFENLFNILAGLCSSIGHQFYKQPGLANALVASVFQGIGIIPDYRMRPIIRLFLKSLVNKCPKTCFGQVLAPVLNHICPHMLNRLTEKWKQLIQARESPNFDENNTDSQEVIDDVLGRQLTREYLDVVKAILTSGGGSDLSLTGATLSASSESLNKGGGGSHHLNLSELGHLVMRDDGLGQCITLTLLNALNWPDSQASARASALLEVVLPILASSEQMSSADAAQVMFNILKALHTLGQHEMNSIALTQLSILAYEQLRPKHASVADVLAQIPGINADDLKRFDDRVLASGKENGTKDSKASDRVIKTMFKKLVGNFVGKDVAQRFRKEVVIKNLPTLQLLNPKPKNANLVGDSNNDDIGITNLFANGTSPAKKTPFML